MSKAKELLKRLQETGEMTDADIKPGGEWHGVRLDLERICKVAKKKAIVKPFDKYQGPYALVISGSKTVGKLWMVDDEKYFFEPMSGSKKFEGYEEEMINFLSNL